MRPLIALLLCLAALPALAATETGYMAIDVETGRVLDAARADETFMPASVVKLPTALSVLDRLGPDHRYHTRLAHTGTIADGVLRGDLYLVGGGDPMLDHPALADMALALKSQGVDRVDGRFLFDATALPHIPILNDRQPPDASYNPGLDGLSLDHNRFLIDWEGGRPVGAQIPLDPLPVGAPHPRHGRAWLPVRAPGDFTARTFRWAADQAGVTLPPPQAGRVPAGARVLVTHASPPLAEILRAVLFFSNNVATEILALSATGAPSPGAAAAVVRDDLRREIPDLDTAGLVLPNTSGLDDAARMTPRQCARIALEAARSEAFRTLLPPLLMEPFAASDPRSPSPTPLRAKTGTLAYARALAGVVETRRGKGVAFCVMTDDKAERAAYAALPFAARDDEKPAARAWRAAAKQMEESLVLGWRERF